MVAIGSLAIAASRVSKSLNVVKADMASGSGIQLFGATNLLRQRVGVLWATGDAHLRIGLENFPKGTRTDLTYGGLFTQYTLSKGQQMEPAEQK